MDVNEKCQSRVCQSKLAILLTTRDFVCCINTGAKIREFVKTRDFVPIEATDPP